MIPIPVMQFINSFYSTVFDNVNILEKKRQIKTSFYSSFLENSPYTHNFDIHMAITILCKACQKNILSWD